VSSIKLILPGLIKLYSKRIASGSGCAEKPGGENLSGPGRGGDGNGRSLEGDPEMKNRARGILGGSYKPRTENKIPKNRGINNRNMLIELKRGKRYEEMNAMSKQDRL
jgi:hypothetical protein